MSVDFGSGTMGLNIPRPGPTNQQIADFWASKNAASFAAPETNTPVTPSGPSDADLQRQADDAAMARQLQQQEYERQARQSAVIDSVKAIFAQYGLSSLGDKIVQYAKQGMSADAIAIALRATPEYKQRFPAMEALSNKGRAISEAEYIEYERTAAQLEQRYGFPQGLLSNSVTDLLTKEVSAAELNDRAILASAAAIEAPEDLRTQMTEFYGIDQGGLAAYFLDPDRALPLLEKQYATSVIGTEARRQGVSIDVTGAEGLQGFGVTQEQAREGFGQVARMGAFTQGRGDVVSQQQLISGTFQQDQQALQNIERAQRARTGRFQEGGGFTATQQGISGLGSAATR